MIAWTALWNVTGNPAASVPAGLAADGLPVAVQLVGRIGEETTLLALAAQLERTRPWPLLTDGRDLGPGLGDDRVEFGRRKYEPRSSGGGGSSPVRSIRPGSLRLLGGPASTGW